MPYSEYCVPFNPNPLHHPRKIRLVAIGAGLAGITLAYKIIHEHKLEDIIDLTIYERQSDVGGTWLANRYPGLTCDGETEFEIGSLRKRARSRGPFPVHCTCQLVPVPIHVYTLPFSPKHDWTRFMAPGSEIRDYIKDTTTKLGLERLMVFNSTVLETTWNEQEGIWDLLIDQNGKQIQDHCDILVGVTGTQNTPLKPEIPGLGSFKGPVVHTGSWDDKLYWKDKRVAVIGNGSSGIQCFGAMQKETSKIAHYIRTPTWISMNYLAQFTKDGSNFAYSDEEKETFLNPKELAAYRRKLESASNGIFKNLVFDNYAQDVKVKFRAAIEKIMKERLAHSPELQKRLLPTYQPWCRRLTPGDDYLTAFQSPDAHLFDSPITVVDANGIHTQDGGYEEWDIIVAATGFLNNRIPPWRMTGRNGTKLADRWAQDADGYLSVCAPSMPNYFAIGQTPNFTIANGSVLSAFGFVAEYILQWARKIATEDIHSVCPSEQAVEAYNIYLQEILRRTAWNKDCDSWYKKGRVDEYRTGITAIYPGSMQHFRSMLETIRGEDFDIKYRSNNRFNFYGCGLTQLDLTDGADLAFYLEDTMKLENML